ncbi:hypothetical protein FB446DRAFT_708884 [Lentinula raphanica]|nr:hypothetical protein FB446DRAFT_708884 [Lentinula raphanica]
MVAVIHAHLSSSANRGRIGGIETRQTKLEALTERRRFMSLSSTVSSPGNSLLFLTKVYVVLIFVLKSSSFSSSNKVPIEQMFIEQSLEAEEHYCGQKQFGVNLNLNNHLSASTLSHLRLEHLRSIYFLYRTYSHATLVFATIVLMTNSNTSKNLNIPTLMISTSIDDVQTANIAQRRVLELRHDVLGACQTFANFRTKCVALELIAVSGWLASCSMTQAVYNAVDTGILVGISSQVNRMVEELHRVEARTGTPSPNSVENIHIPHDRRSALDTGHPFCENRR